MKSPKLIAAAAVVGPLELGGRCESAGGVVSGQGPGETSLRAAGRPNKQNQQYPNAADSRNPKKRSTAIEQDLEALQQSREKQ